MVNIKNLIIKIKYVKYQFRFNRYPEPITHVKNSSYILSQKLLNYWNKDRKEYIKDIIRNGLWFEDFEEDDINWLNEARTQWEYEIFLANMISFRARLGVISFINFFF